MQLTLSRVTHAFPNQSTLFAPLSLDLSGGEVVAITGPSGSGKSTILAIMAGELKPSSGDVEYQDVNQICWVLQNPHGSARRSALDHVALPYLAQGFSRAEARDRALEVMEQFGLTQVAQQTFAQLSGGQSQRLMLARAVATAPALLLIDEPTAQLDRKNAESVITRIAALAAPDRIVVISTHDTRLARSATQRVELGIK